MGAFFVGLVAADKEGEATVWGDALALFVNRLEPIVGDRESKCCTLSCSDHI